MRSMAPSRRPAGPPPPGMMYSRGPQQSPGAGSPPMGSQPPVLRAGGAAPRSSSVGGATMYNRAQPQRGGGGPLPPMAGSRGSYSQSAPPTGMGARMAMFDRPPTDAQAGSLANQSVAAANAFGQMANNYYNMMGQMGYVGGSIANTGITANASRSKGNVGSGFGGGGWAGGGGDGGYGGFDVAGPGGDVASGVLGGLAGGGGVGGMGGSMSGGMSANVQRGAPVSETRALAGQGYGFLNGLMDRVHSDNSDARIFGGMLNDQFNAYREATAPDPFRRARSQTNAAREWDRYYAGT